MITRSLILATDLDGTFLAGPETARSRLRELFGGRDAPRGTERPRLVFVTGRGLESILPVLVDPLVPAPDYIIADVVATVVRGSTLEPVLPLQTDIADRWPGTNSVLRGLSRFTYLHRQEVPQERRCSYLVDEKLIGEDLRNAVQALGCRLLLSAGQYLDVLPRGVSKGRTLRRLCEQEGLDPSSVVVAGDTLNDLSLFEAGFRGVVVGGAEEALVEEVAGRKDVYLATAPGAAGILKGLAHHGFVSADDASVPSSPPPARRRGTSRLVMVYHRLPFDEVRSGDGVVRREPLSPNGIIPTLLGFFAHSGPGSWVAWSKQESRRPPGHQVHVPVDPERYPDLVAARIALTDEDVDLFYKRFSKEAFWPVIFSFPDRAEFRQDHWEHYVDINRTFAVQAAREAAENALVWVHDYNLWLVPGLLRQLRPDVRIAFFHHTAFPAPDVFNILPWRRDILGSLLACDYVGFHIPRYVENFCGAVSSFAPMNVLATLSCAPRFMTYGCALGVDRMTRAIEVGGHTVRLGAHPVGIDLERLGASLATRQSQARVAKIRAEVGDRQCVLSVERLDYVKGPLEKLLAFERLLERNPELHGRVIMINVLTPPAPGMEIYSAVRRSVDQVVGRINGRFSKLDWTPVRYYYRSLPYEEVLAYYAVADVAWISPLRDGLNLVAKEYIAAKAATGGTGVLVLSEFAGAAVELHGSLLTNPYDSADMEATLHRALTLEQADRDYRMRRLVDIVRVNDVSRWGREFLEEVRGQA